MTFFEKWLGRLWQTVAGQKPVSETSIPASAPESPREPYLTETVVFGMHRYRTRGEDSSVYFVDEARGIRKMLVDSRGVIQDFPGIIREDFWVRQISPRALQPQIRFRTSFEKRGNGWIMLWQIQPDGQYWEDEDRFGGTNDLEVTLYTHVDGDGNFTDPFRIYQIGSRNYTLDRHWAAYYHSYEKALTALRGEEPPKNCGENLIPTLKSAANWQMSTYTAFQDVAEARRFWQEPLLRESVLEISKALLERQEPLEQLFSHPFDWWLQSGLTLFRELTGEPVFGRLLDKFFEGKPDGNVLKALEAEEKK